MNKWQKAGLQELGITEEQYKSLPADVKVGVDALLKESGHVMDEADC